MNEADAQDSFRKTVALRNGSALRIDSARASDRQRLVPAVQGLDRQARHTRCVPFRKRIGYSEPGRLDMGGPMRRADDAAGPCRCGAPGARPRGLNPHPRLP